MMNHDANDLDTAARQVELMAEAAAALAQPFVTAADLVEGDRVNIHGTEATTGTVTNVERVGSGVLVITLDGNVAVEVVGWARVDRTIEKDRVVTDRFWIFATEEYEADGGMCDLYGRAETLAAAVAGAELAIAASKINCHIYDAKADKIILHWQGDGLTEGYAWHTPDWEGWPTPVKIHQFISNYPQTGTPVSERTE